jgi:hypothetical protein
MRTYDCDECGETLTGADDSELARAVSEHYSSEHEPLDDERVAELLAAGAYDAMDS